MLDVALEYWDPTNHIFVFPGGEACPLAEDFGALAGWNPDAKHVSPVFVYLWITYYRKHLGLPNSEAHNMIEDEVVDLYAIYNKFDDCNDEVVSPIHIRRALGLFLLHIYVFDGSIREDPQDCMYCMGETKLLGVVMQM